ncbi:MAG: transposase [Veillonellaceae bacterium]|nr:transposase [Veillonellaceae bacterium]
MQHVSYCSDHHRITKELEAYVCDLLALGTYTNKQVAELCGLHQHTVKAIDKRRLESLYVKDGKLVKPKHYARFLGIDEFKLHDGHQYATHIIDMATGHVLWIAQGKKKKVVYDFIELVGMDWMRHVDAVALDMNSDFEEAFLEKCPHIRPVFDYFHLVKNFNDKVVSEVRKDEFRRLMEEGREEEARMLKRSRSLRPTAKRWRERTLSPLQERCCAGRASCSLRRKRDGQDGIYPGTRNSLRRIVCS